MCHIATAENSVFVSSAVESVCVCVCTASISLALDNKNSNKIFPSLKASSNLLSDFQRSPFSAGSTNCFPLCLQHCTPYADGCPCPSRPACHRHPSNALAPKEIGLSAQVKPLALQRHLGYFIISGAVQQHGLLRRESEMFCAKLTKFFFCSYLIHMICTPENSSPRSWVH